MNRFSLVELAPGCVLVQQNNQGFLIGATPEVVKTLIVKHPGVQLQGVVLTDTAHIQGISLMSLEFPLYKFLFIDGGLPRGERFVVVGSMKQLARAREMLRITLFGPNSTERRSWSRRYRDLSHREAERGVIEAAFFRLKRDGVELELDDLVEFRRYESGASKILDLSIRHESRDRFVLNTEEQEDVVALRLDERPKPPFPISYLQSLPAPNALGLQVLSYGNGFDPSVGCTALLLTVQGVRYLVDAAPYVVDMLDAAGISVAELGGVFLTHVHDDHSSILELLESGPKLRIYTTCEVYESLLVKLAAQLDYDLNVQRQRLEVEELFHWEPISIGSPFSLHGARLLVHRTVHSIPCFGFRITLDGSAEKSVLIVGDHAGPSKLREMLDARVLSAERFEALTTLVRGNEGLVIMDGGGDPAGLHANPAEPELRALATAMGPRLIFGHRGSVVKGAAEITLARPGAHYTIEPGREDFVDPLVLQEALHAWGVTNPIYVRSLWSTGEVLSLPSQSVVCHEGQMPDGFYFVLAGTLDVLSGERQIARLARGDSFGEMAILSDGVRNATVRSRSAVRLLRIPVDTFVCFVREVGLLPCFEKLWQNRALLVGVELFHGLPQSAVAELSQCLKVFEVAPGEEIVREGEPGEHAYVLVSGAVEVVRDATRVIAELSTGAVFGEAVPLGVASHRTATVRASQASLVLVLPGNALRKYAALFLSVEYRLRMLLHERGLDSRAA